LESVIGTLRSGSTEQISVSIVFGFDVPTTFSIKAAPGSDNKVDKDAVVYLSGILNLSV
jgi:hypothetical protein